MSAPPAESAALALPGWQNRARSLYQWTWKGKRAISLSLGPKKIPDAFADQPKRTAVEIAAIPSVRIRYEEGRTPGPARTASPTEETADTERAVGGL